MGCEHLQLWVTHLLCEAVYQLVASFLPTGTAWVPFSHMLPNIWYCQTNRCQTLGYEIVPRYFNLYFPGYQWQRASFHKFIGDFVFLHLWVVCSHLEASFQDGPSNPSLCCPLPHCTVGHLWNPGSRDGLSLLRLCYTRPCSFYVGYSLSFGSLNLGETNYHVVSSPVLHGKELRCPANSQWETEAPRKQLHEWIWKWIQVTDASGTSSARATELR